MKRLGLILLCLLFSTLGFSQNHLSVYYNPKTFQAHPYMWDATQDAFGRIYFANNKGVIRFDGHQWFTFKTPYPVRKICLGVNSEIYVACEGDFGVIRYKEDGNYEYQSIRKQLAAQQVKSENVESVFAIGKSIYFYFENHLIQVESNEKKLDTKSFEIGTTTGAFAYNGKLYLNTERLGLGVFEYGKINIISGGEQLAKSYLSASCTQNQKAYVCNSKGQLFVLTGKKLEWLSNNLGEGVISMSCLEGGKLAVGKMNDGVSVFDLTTLQSKPIQTESKEMYHVFTDKEGNLWLSHGKGITYVMTQLPIQCLHSGLLTGSITDMLLQGNTLYISTTAGFYACDANTGDNLKMLGDIRAECWDIIEDKEHIYIATTDGLYQLFQGKVSIILPGETILHLSKGNKSGKLYALGATGAWEIESNNIPQLKKEIPAQSTSVYEGSNGLILVGTYHQGLVQIGKESLNIDSTLKEEKVTIRTLGSKVYFQKENKIFEWDEAKQTINYDEKVGSILGGAIQLNQKDESNFVVVTPEELKIFKGFEKQANSVLYVLSGKATVVEANKQRYWLAFDDHIYFLEDKMPTLEKPKVSINAFLYGKNLIGYSGYFVNEKGLIQENQIQIPEIDFDAMPVSIEFGMNTFIQADQQLYSYKIEGLSNEWSEWQKKGKVELQNLSGGHYKILVKAIDAFGRESEEVAFKFYVKSPWYLSAMAFLAYILAFALLMYFLVFLNQKRLISKNKELEKKVNERTKELKEEKAKSDNLLLNILPVEVAEELKRTGSLEAKQFDDVSVLFTDFVGFTSISEKLNPRELVDEIHHCFKAFDEIIERNNLEKIKTIGDAYMAVGGMPNKDVNHAKNCVQAAIDIHAFIKQYQIEKKKLQKPYFEIRMGINSGSVIAGIVGVKKFAYDIWGDTVNTAARMEQNCEPGKINISGTTNALVKTSFKCSYRGAIEAKNKGAIDMYYVDTNKRDGQ